MSNETERWSCIQFTLDQVVKGDLAKLRGKVELKYKDRNKPVGFCVYSHPAFNVESDSDVVIVSFSPKAVKHCRRLVNNFSPCTKPDKTLPSLNLLVGEAVCLDLLSDT